jgi:hypothetical protein
VEFSQPSSAFYGGKRKNSRKSICSEEILCNAVFFAFLIFNFPSRDGKNPKRRREEKKTLS